MFWRTTVFYCFPVYLQKQNLFNDWRQLESIVTQTKQKQRKIFLRMCELVEHRRTRTTEMDI